MITSAEQQHLDASLRLLIERCRSLTIDDLNSRAIITARHSLLDWFGCAVAGANEPAARRFRGIMDPAPGDTPLIGTPDSLHWRDALVINAFNGHLLDFDDMLPSFSGHPSAVVVPALLTVGEQTGAGVDKLLTALVVGTEVGDWVASHVLPGHYDAGWHATGTLGTFAAAAAVCHLRGLSHDEWISALDAAATQAAGLKAMFGTLAKPMHAGNASQAGVVAASLSTITSSSGRALNGETGFISNYRGAGTVPPARREGFAIEGMLYKTYASCFMTQAAVDAGAQAATLPGLDRALITLSVSPKLADVCAIEDPRTSNDAKFSLHATFALSALGFDLSTEEAFHPDNLQDPAYQDLRERITLRFDPELAGQEPRIGVHIRRARGESWDTTVDRGQPATDLAAREKQLVQKFTRLVEPHLGATRTRLASDLILHSSRTTIPELTAATTQPLIPETTI
ncbi:MmgE/PrpD family protein [Corynebacterium comes]|uniref:MmgE/PrpD family protein n=1 Tax=Corynebacterium comes TaxID=2675218 RepID=A0A6B8VWQ8_9CORY|nr:MmgE/PrpD family protein [Corynebacterium comes]QGU04147.1 MmgE/PrpD family protein [Corynebacterium comes]